MIKPMNLLDQYMDMLGDVPLTDEDIMREIFAAELSELEERVMELNEDYLFDCELEECSRREDRCYENVTTVYPVPAMANYINMTMSLVPP